MHNHIHYMIHVFNVSHWFHREAKFVFDSPALSYIKTYTSEGYDLNHSILQLICISLFLVSTHVGYVTCKLSRDHAIVIKIHVYPH